MRQVKCSLVDQDLVQRYLMVFDGHIRVMDRETFHITLREGTVPFCVKTPRAIPFAYRDKLKAELDLLQEQGIITPVTEVTEWCAQLLLLRRRAQIGSGCVSTYPTSIVMCKESVTNPQHQQRQ